MKAFNAKLQGILHTGNQYVIPVFQRFYSWQRPDWQRLWESIIELHNSDDSVRGHFMGSLVFVPEASFPNKMPAFQVIDGQQRLTSLTLLLCALRNVAKANDFIELATEVDENYLVHRLKKNREHFRVYPRQRDRDSYMAIIRNDGIAGGRMSEALEFFERQIRDLPESQTEDVLQNLFSLLHSRLDFVHITLEGENPYQIFKSLNSTGVDLSEGDLIRNFMFMRVEPSQQDDFDDQKWKPLEKHFENQNNTLDSQSLSAFFRDFLMQEGRYVAPNATFESFERRYSAPDFNPVDLAVELQKNVDRYDIILGTKPHADNLVTSALAQLKELESSTTYPLLLRLLRLSDEGAITTSDLAGAVRLLAGFIFRRMVCGESSRAYGRWFVTACTAINDAPLEDLSGFLRDKGFPNDARFTSAFEYFNLYGSRYDNVVLKALERAYHHREPADLSSTQIEHIMPQTLTDLWKQELGPDWNSVHERLKHTIGNLTLTAYNQELGNKSFNEKRDGFQGFTGYRNSNIILTRELHSEQIWTETEIINRATRLAQKATAIWPGA